MTKKVFYERVVSPGGRVSYAPVSEYDSEYLDSFSEGTHLVMCYPGGQSRRYNVDPDYAAMIAAGRVAGDVISKAVVKASEMRPHNKPVTERQKKAWEALVKAFGDDRYYVEIPSAMEITEEGVKAMIEEADKLLTNPAVKQAWENFQLLCDLSRKH